MTSTPSPAELEETEEEFVLLETPSLLDTFIEFWNEMCRLIWTSTTKLAAVTGVLALGATVLHHIYANEREIERIRLREEIERRRLAGNEEADRRLDELLTNVQLQYEREKEEDERLHRSKISTIQSDASRYDWEIVQSDRTYQSESDRLKLAAETRLEKLKQKAALQNLMREQMAQAQQFYNEQSNKAELAQMQRDSEFDQLQFKEALKEYDSRYQQAKGMQEEKERVRRREDERDEQAFQQRLHEMRETFARHLEELKRQDSARRREMEYQAEELRRQLQMKVWSMEIENNWTRRLNALRNSFDDVKKAWQMPSEKPEILKLQIEHAIEAVGIQRALMEREARAMEKMHHETGKEFLLTIKEAVEDVKRECDRLEYALKSSPPDVRQIKDCFSRLLQASLEIPTLAELKKQNGN